MRYIVAFRTGTTAKQADAAIRAVGGSLEAFMEDLSVAVVKGTTLKSLRQRPEIVSVEEDVHRLW